MVPVSASALQLRRRPSDLQRFRVDPIRTSDALPLAKQGARRCCLKRKARRQLNRIYLLLRQLLRACNPASEVRNPSGSRSSWSAARCHG